MKFSSAFGVALTVVAISTLVAGELVTVITFDSVEMFNRDESHFGDWTYELHNTKKNTLVSMACPIKEDLPITMINKFIFELEGQDPMENEVTICNGLNDESVGKSIVKAGEPDFPEECPFIANADYVIRKWDPPSDLIPSGMEGPFTTTMIFKEEDKTDDDFAYKVVFKGEIMVKAV